MKVSYLLIPVFIILITPQTPVAYTPHSTSGNPILADTLQKLEEVFPTTYSFTIKFLGVSESSIDTNLFQSLLPKTQAPIDVYPSLFSGRKLFRTNYSITYNLDWIDNNASNLQDFINYTQSVATRDKIPGFDSIVNNPVFDNFTQADYIPSTLVENYLSTQYNVTEPTLFIIDTYTVNPSKFFPHFYNVSEFDIDLQSVPRPYGSTYQISGGGQHSNILWIDISAGPTEYRGQTWDHASTISDQVSFTHDLGWYVQTAIELRFLPSYLYNPISAGKNVKFEYLLVDLAHDPSFDWFSLFDPNSILSYSQVNPGVNWTYSLSEWDYSSDVNFLNVLNLAQNSTSHKYDGISILNYLDTVYKQLFNSSDSDTQVIPNFLFAFPDDWMFTQFLGVANNDNYGQFSYVVGAANQKWGIPGYDLQLADWFTTESPVTLSTGQGFVISSNSYEGSYSEIFETSVSSNSTLSVEILDSRNFNLFNSSMPYTPLDSFDVVNSTLSHNTTINRLSRYYWFVYNSGTDNTTITLSIDQYRDRAFGFTFVMMHEGGHGLGLSHPHDGWSWILGYNYLDWLWDLSYSQMTYAAHLNEVSYLDTQTLQRGSFSVLYNETVYAYNNLIDLIQSENRYIPFSLNDTLDGLDASIFQIASDFYSHAENSSYDDQFANLSRSLLNLKTSVTDILFCDRYTCELQSLYLAHFTQCSNHRYCYILL